MNFISRNFLSHASVLEKGNYSIMRIIQVRELFNLLISVIWIRDSTTTSIDTILEVREIFNFLIWPMPAVTQYWK